MATSSTSPRALEQAQDRPSGNSRRSDRRISRSYRGAYRSQSLRVRSLASWLIIGCQISQPDDLADRGGNLGEPLVGVVGAIRRGGHHAVPQVVAEQADGYFLQGAGGGGDLNDHVRAPGIGLD